MTSTGGTRVLLLQEISDLLGLRVTDVQRDPEPRPVDGPGGRREHPKDIFGEPRKRGWDVHLAEPLVWPYGRLQWSKHVASSAVLRTPRSLNALARYLGRPVDAPELTGSDGRRLLSLMHHLVESTEGNS